MGGGYDKYVKMQAVALLFSTTGGVLSMQSMLYAIGVGSGSVPLAATLNWIIKDGTESCRASLHLITSLTSLYFLSHTLSCPLLPSAGP